nr:hypothetical protein JVH1_8271 [Rhodococcus sp. JVH1]
MDCAEDEGEAQPVLTDYRAERESPRKVGSNLVHFTIRTHAASLHVPVSSPRALAGTNAAAIWLGDRIGNQGGGSRSEIRHSGGTAPDSNRTSPRTFT